MKRKYYDDPNWPRLRELLKEMSWWTPTRNTAGGAAESILYNLPSSERIEELITGSTGKGLERKKWTLAVTQNRIVACHPRSWTVQTFYTTQLRDVVVEGQDLSFVHDHAEFGAEPQRFEAIRPREKLEPVAAFLAQRGAEGQRDRVTAEDAAWDEALSEDELRREAAASQNRRVRIPESVRHEVWRRDQGRCSVCGSRERLEFDHIVPVSQGGSNTARNIELLCEPCNRKKGASI